MYICIYIYVYCHGLQAGFSRPTTELPLHLQKINKSDWLIDTKLYIQYCVAYLTSDKMSCMHVFTQNNIPKIKKTTLHL